MQRLLIDTDGGIDDAAALLYALGSPGLEIEAITTVYGNVAVEAATRNVLEILRVAGTEQPPRIAQGSAAPQVGSWRTAPHIHGEDGLGGWIGRTAGSGRGDVDPLPAAEVIAAVARRYPGEVTLVTLGPLTNIAAAERQDPKGFRLLKEIVTMGGAVAVPGNMTAVAEFNVLADPEAARAVFRCGLPLLLVGLDVTRKCALTRDRLESWLAGRTDVRSRFLACLSEQGLANSSEAFLLHDPLAVAAALDRSLVVTRRMRVDVETRGELTRGMVVADRREWERGGENADVCLDVDAERFLDEVGARVFRSPV